MTGIAKKAVLYGRTLARLRPRQVFHILKDRLLRRFPGVTEPLSGTRLYIRPPLPLRFACTETGPFVEARENGAFVDVFGEELEWSEGKQWRLDSGNRLRLENLRYLEFLYHLVREGERGKKLALQIALDFLENIAGRGDSAYTAARRLSVLLTLSRFASDRKTYRFILNHAAGHARYILGRVEYHLGANHLLKCGKALYLAGLCLRHPESALWRRRGFEIFKNALAWQVLPDGGHCERSLTYHCLAMEDLFDIQAVLESAKLERRFRRRIKNSVIRMAEFLARCLHPDGSMPLFGDTARGLSLPPFYIIDEVNRRYGAKVATPDDDTLEFPASGFYGRRYPGGTFLIIKAGPIGYPEQPGHAHCDMLSFELSLKGRRIAVDTGIRDYAPGDERDYVRSTAAHNVIQAGGREQADFWASHRFATLARPRAVRAPIFQDMEGRWELSAAARPFHGSESIWVRRFVLDKKSLKVFDTLAPRSRLVSRIHLHPDWKYEGSGRFHAPGASVEILSDSFFDRTETEFYEDFLAEGRRRITLVQDTITGTASYFMKTS